MNECARRPCACLCAPLGGDARACVPVSVCTSGSGLDIFPMFCGVSLEDPFASLSPLSPVGVSAIV